jgi:transposase
MECRAGGGPATAVAILHVARGHSHEEAAAVVCAHRESVGRWVQRYRSEGASGLETRPGRGRPPSVDAKELETYVRQSPRQFGLTQTRWTLEALAAAVPSLRGFTPSGVYRALVRLGFRWKRGQPAVHSPDPEYGEKRGGWQGFSRRPGSVRRR